MNLQFDSHRFGPNLNPSIGDETSKYQFVVKFTTADRNAPEPILALADKLYADFQKKLSGLKPTPASARASEIEKQIAATRAESEKVESEARAASEALSALWEAGTAASSQEEAVARLDGKRALLTKKINVLDAALLVAQKQASDEAMARDREARAAQVAEYEARAAKLKKKLELVVNDICVELSALTRASNTLL